LSEIGKVDINNSNKIFMTNVVATIYLVDSSPVKITSKYANYNNISHETSFFENVKVTHLIHKVTSENLDISFNDNSASMYNNIVYNKPGTNLKADRLEIDLITKNSKIFMYNKTEKIKIINNK
jgi:lipopolysaccharide export system protein LptA